MKLKELKQKVQEYMYLEDTGVIDVALSAVVANKMKLSSVIWLAIVGESSGGKSQILNPILKTDEEYFIKIDDLTENTFLSGMHGGGNSLLNDDRVHNSMVISDLTVLFSKGAEARNAILGQFRAIFDGYLKKDVGNQKDSLEWNGRMGVLAGCTPSIYRHFEEVADMGERFIYYRLPKNDPEKATQKALSRTLYGKDLDDKLTELYGEYLRSVVVGVKEKRDQIVLEDRHIVRIVEMSGFAELLRTTVKFDQYRNTIMNLPNPALPMRTAIQLKTMVLGSIAINVYEGSEEIDTLAMIDTLSFSLANEEIRKVLQVVYRMQVDQGLAVTKAEVADEIGLGTEAAGAVLQRLASVGVLERKSGEGAHQFRIVETKYLAILGRLFPDVEVKNATVPKF